ncbi:MAG: tetratricopeptide repeat protein, partial [Archangium sp.]
GTLPAEDAARIAAHLERCESSRRVVAMLMKASSRSRSSSDSIEPTPHLALATHVGRYELSRFVGAGAMGMVFEAQDPALHRRVALKVMRSSTSQRAQELLQREAQVMAKLSHRHVATVFDAGVHETRSWVAMEFIEGRTLRGWLAEGTHGPRAILERLLEAGRGLEAAHAAGVIHRDFKPDNVLIDARDGGRAVVTDFGLSLASREVSQSGRALVGTPAYMAPEQRAGVADARSDQFSFAVTAVEAFTGQRGEADMNVTQARVPRALRAPLTRALKSDPSARWPDMTALLAAMTPARRESRVLAGAAALAVTGLAAVGSLSWRRAHVCDDAGIGVTAIWTPAARENITSTFLATKVPFAPVAAAGLTAELDRWVDHWRGHAVDACEDTELRREQSGESMDLRRACLDARLQEFSSLLSALSTADAEVVKHADQIVARLSPLSACDDVKALRAPIPLPASPTQAARITGLRDALSNASGLRVTSQFKEARAALATIEADALDAGYRPLEADVLVQLGMLDAELEQFDSAEDRLHRALVAAQAGGHTRAAAQAWIALTLLEGIQRGHPAEAHRSAELASAASERLGKPAALEGAISTNLGTVLAREGRHEEARAAYERSLQLARDDDAESHTIAQALNAIGAQERHLRNPDAALKRHQEALALITRDYSATHPSVAPIMKNIGNVHLEAGRFDEALEWYGKTIAVQTDAFGAESLEVADTQSNVAGALLRQGKMKEAEPLLRAAIATTDARLGVDNPALFAPLNNLSVLLKYTGRIDEAEAALNRALKIAEKTYGPVHEDVATTLVNLGDVQLARRDFAASVKSYQRAIEVTEKTDGPAHSNLADCWGGLAFPLMELKDWKAALAATEKAQAIYAKSPGQPYAEGLVHVAHARALWETTPAKRETAKQEARDARAALEKVGAQPEELAEIDAWLTKH